MNGEDRTAVTISLIRKTSQKIRKVIRVKANATPSTLNPTKEKVVRGRKKDKGMNSAVLMLLPQTQCLHLLLQH